jgi:hypothetical protein
MRQGQKKKGHRATHGLHLAMVVLHVRVMVHMARHHRFAVLPIVVVVVAAIGVGVARSEVLTVGVRIELRAIAGSEITACARAGVTKAIVATATVPIKANFIFALLSWWSEYVWRMLIRAAAGREYILRDAHLVRDRTGVETFSRNVRSRGSRKRKQSG